MGDAKYKLVHLLGKEYRLCVTTLRKSCEHTVLGGAISDFATYTFHLEVHTLEVFGKLAFVVGALGIYLLHYEETI